MSEKHPEASHAIEIVLVLIVQTPIERCLRKHMVETCHASPSPRNCGENALLIFSNIVYSVVTDAE